MTVTTLIATFALTAIGWLFLALSSNAPVPDAWGFRGFPGIFAVAFGWIGYLIARRQHRNPIGWSFLIAGLLSAVQVAASEYGSYALSVRTQVSRAARSVRGSTIGSGCR